MAAPRLRRLLLVAVATSLLSMVALLVYFQARRDLDLVGALRDLDPRTLLLAVGLHMVSHLAWTLRIRTLARGLGVRAGTAFCWRLVTAGQFAAAVTPARAGSEPLRLTLLVRAGAGGVPASRTVVADRTSDLVLFAVMGTGGALLLPSLFGPDAAVLRGLAFLAAAVLATFIAALVYGLARPRALAAVSQAVWNRARRLVGRPSEDGRVADAVAEFLAQVRNGVVALARESPGRLVVAAALSVLLWSLEYGVLWVLLRGLGVEMPLEAVLAAGVLLTMLSALPLSVGGAGVAEVAAVLLLGPWAGATAPVVVLLWRASSYYYDVVVGGAVAAWSLPKKDARASPAP